MLTTVRAYLDATLAIAIMSALGVVSGFIAAAVTDDRRVVIATAAAVFVLTGAVLIFRLWRTTKNPAPATETEI